MFTRISPLWPSAIAAVVFCIGSASSAQGSGMSIEAHANENVSAASIGLPEFPTAKPSRNAKSDSAADIGISFGTFHFRVMVAKYVTYATPANVLDFYRKPLSKYGEVLDCDHGIAVGAVKVAKSGLTCADRKGKNVHADDGASTHRELRSGTPERFRIVALDSADATPTQFTLVLLEVPKNDDSH
jgi:hypothetical protein